jgi:hypothetical protein
MSMDINAEAKEVKVDPAALVDVALAVVDAAGGDRRVLVTGATGYM